MVGIGFVLQTTPLDKTGSPAEYEMVPPDFALVELTSVNEVHKRGTQGPQLGYPAHIVKV